MVHSEVTEGLQLAWVQYGSIIAHEKKTLMFKSLL